MPYLELAGKKIGSFHQGNRSDLSPVYLLTLLAQKLPQNFKKNLKVAPSPPPKKKALNFTKCNTYAL